MCQYGIEREIGGRKIPPLVNSSAIKREFFVFKLQATMDWLDKSFKDVWSMITWNHTLKVKYGNLLVLVEITRVQCISTTSYERAFSVQNCIKIKQRNRMLTKNLESVLRVALEGPIKVILISLMKPLEYGKTTPSLGIYSLTRNGIYVVWFHPSKKILISCDLCIKCK
jgi:hypothetical protein